MTVTSTTSVREVLAGVPGARAILERYGLNGCGGCAGPAEPLDVFARAHGVAPERLLQELHSVASGSELPVVDPEPPAAPPESYRYFLRAAVLIGALAGAALGAINLSWIAVWGFTGEQPNWPWWPALVQAHGNAQLYGWCGLFVMGVASHSIPRMLQRPAPRPGLMPAVFALVLGGILLGLVAQPLAAASPWDGLWVAANALQWAGVSLFAAYLLPTVGIPRDPNRAFLCAGGMWLWIGATLRLALAGQAASAGSTMPDAALNAAYLHVMAWGFLLSFVLAYSMRLLPAFTGSPAPRVRGAWAAFGLLTAGVGLNCAGLWAAPLLSAFAMLATAAGVGAALLALRLWTPALTAGDPEGRWLLRFARTAYFWLAAAAVILLGLRIAEAAGPVTLLHQHAFGGAARHALTVGFVSLMMVGVAWRILPIFSGSERPAAYLLPLVFGLLVTGNTLRVVGQMGAGTWGGAWYGVMGLSGWLETFALLLFAMDVLRLMAGTPENAVLPDPGPPVGLSLLSPVGPLVAHRPWLVPVFARHGMGQVTNPLFQRTVGRRVTVREACLRFQAPPEQFLAELERAELEEAERYR